MATTSVEANNERTDAIASSAMDTDESSTKVASILNRLRSPTPSDLSRNRKLPATLQKGQRKERVISSELLNISIADRVREFPGENLCRNRGKLFCNACRDPISVKKSIIRQHIKSAKHESGKVCLAHKEKRERNTAEMLVDYDKATHPVGESLSEVVHVHRVKAVTTFLRAGVPLSKLDIFRELLEENVYRLSDSTNLYSLIPFVHQEEQANIQKEISGKSVSVIFDGTTNVCEALAIILQFVDD